ncbi:SLC13 family permease [Clostridium merdae]|uniref:SLC13 family permease n=1 Tax=Clostridium merdae TaxID=1958780 RepID=UPI000A26C88B|nr:SLC13 family permease [Clostridium merdae]
MLALIGALLIITIMFLLIQEKVSAPVAFIVLPIIAALCAGFGIPEISKFIVSGMSSVINNTLILLFSITYFSMMGDIGLFDPMVKFMMKKTGNSVAAVCIAIAATAVVASIDGGGSTTALIVIPAFLPIVKKLNMRKESIIGLMAASIFMNLTPWAGPPLLCATGLNVELPDLYAQAFPGIMILVCLMPVLVFAHIWYQKKTGAGLTDSGKLHVEIEQEEEQKEAISRKKYVFNVILTLALISSLFTGVSPKYILFMVALAIGLIVNYPIAKTQRKKIKQLGGEAVPMTVTLFSVGIFLGIAKESGMIGSMATVLVQVLPSFLAPHMHWILAFFGVPLIMALGSNSLYLGLMPVVVQIAAGFGISAVEVGTAFMLGASYGAVISPCHPTTYVTIGLSETSIGSHIKYNIMFLWPAGITALVIATLLGIVPF